jgi:polyphosphate kinase 2 (PPK2 family)
MGGKKRSGTRAKEQGAERKDEKLGGKEYEARLERLHIELVQLQEWVQAKGLKVCIVFEGVTAPARAGPSRRSPSA